MAGTRRRSRLARAVAGRRLPSPFGAPPAYMGEGGSIPFMGMLGEKFRGRNLSSPACSGPTRTCSGRRFLHIPTAKRVSMVIAQVLADQHARSRNREEPRNARNLYGAAVRPGAVHKYRPIIDLFDCDCSVCAKKGILRLIVPPEQFELLQWAGTISRLINSIPTRPSTPSAGLVGSISFYVPRSDPGQDQRWMPAASTASMWPPSSRAGSTDAIGRRRSGATRAMPPPEHTGAANRCLDSFE